VKPVLTLLLVAAAASFGCATKKYVSSEVGGVNQKVDNLSGEVERTQERIQRSETRIDEVDRASRSGIDEARSSAQKAYTKASDAERAAKGKLIYEVTLSNDQVTFPVNHAQVSDEAKVLVDDAVAPITAANKGVFFEIEGHTDSSGPAAYNLKLGEERALAIRNYLHEKHGIALSRMAVISYGEDRPVVDNKTRDNRAHNRRVVVKVLE
jgi:outer membrane protein OmpA-like peptidoglycan-associated protein